MAAAIKALNAKIRSNKYSDYFCSTRTFLPGSAVDARKGKSGTQLQRIGIQFCKQEKDRTGVLTM